MAKLYTHKGDDGSTTLGDGTAVRKDDPRVGAVGTLDELNAHLGVAACLVGLPRPARHAGSGAPTASHAEPAVRTVNPAGPAGPSGGPEPTWQTLHERVVQIQCELFDLGADLARPSDAADRHAPPVATPEQAARLERWIDEAAAQVPGLKAFILPGGHAVAAQLHVCRTVCRRVERRVVALGAHAPINPHVGVYLNRLSDLLFAWARWANHLAGLPDVPWKEPST